MRGLNCFVTPGGKLSRRPGTVAIASGAFNLRVDRAWIYETLDTPPVVYLVVSAFNPASNMWELWYQREASTPTAWAKVADYRDSNSSTRAHEAAQSRGLMFIKSYPAATSSEKLGTIILDGTGGAVVIKPWGAIGPSTPAAIVGQTTLLSAAITSLTATTLTVNSATGFPAAPFVIGVDYEQMNVTAVSGTTFTVTRGYNGTAAATHTANTTVIWRNWSNSAHPITVNVGWKYSYGYVSNTGQYTNRAKFETNPDNLPSTTGPFFNQIPKITVQGLADTVNFPKIYIARTTDGGNIPIFLTTIINTGAGAITFQDNILASASGNSDPQPDQYLDATNFSPDLQINSPPPTVLAPKVTGTDTPVATSPIVSYTGRLWMAIGNVLFYCGNEEINLGIPEECWPAGGNGNFFRFSHPITNIEPTDEALYVFTLQNIYRITGTTKETYAPQILFDNYGHPYGHPRAKIRFGNTLAVLTHDYRVAVIQGTNIEVTSDPLFTDLVDTVNQNQAEFEFSYYADIDKEWLVVTGHVASNTSASRQWVLDIKRSNFGRQRGQWMPYFWYVPWSIPSTAVASGRLAENSAQRRLAFFLWDPKNLVGQWSRIDPTVRTATDYYPAGATNFNVDIVYSLIQNPIGNHVNEKRLPGLTTSAYSVILDRTVFAGDVDPNFYYFFDDFWTNPIAQPAQEDPTSRRQSTAYKTIEYPINSVCQNFAWEITKVNSGDLFEVQRVKVLFSPDSGR